jgi:hypothetical protein
MSAGANPRRLAELAQQLDATFMPKPTNVGSVLAWLTDALHR